jgi:diadenosine tetraphosphate (Ap4A) HIT family hydrolase
MTVCPFCRPEEALIAQNQHALAIADKHPISIGHSLVIPRKHVSSIFTLPRQEYLGCFDLARKVKKVLESRHSPAGFNLTVNSGQAAGQTVEHAHIHVVPRYPGETLKPNVLQLEEC